MRKIITALALSMLCSTSFAAEACEAYATKKKVDECYQKRVDSNREALDEFYEAVRDSTNIPPAVKERVMKDYQSFMRNISKTCPDKACIALAQMEQMRDMQKEVTPYTVPR